MRVGNPESVRSFLAAALILVTAPAAAAAPLGAPRDLRVARPADLRPHPGARTELWELLAVDPRTRRTLSVRMRRAPGLEEVDVFASGGPGHSLRLAQTFQRGGDPRFSGPGGTTTLSRGGLTMTGPEASGRVTLHGARPGPAARGWSLGPAARPAGEVPTGLSWSVPVGPGTLRGELRLGAETLRVDGWRASVEHVWGSFDLTDRAWEYWDAYTVHGRRGEAWIAFGLNRTDTATGPGARDAQWLGVLGRVAGGRTRVCRPRVHRRRWAPAIDEHPGARELRARCGRLRVTLREVRDETTLWADDHVGFFEHADHARASGGGIGFGRHRGHPFG